MMDHPFPSPSTAPCTLLLVAAGRGRRFGGDKPKQYQPLGNLPIVVHTLRALHRHPLIPRIQPVIAPDGADYWQALAPYLTDLPKVSPPIAGGAERQESVWRGLEHLRLDADHWVGIHDAVRPLIAQGLLDRLFAARDHGDALIPALDAHDTVKQSDGHGQVIATLDRARIHLAQTPQVFRHGLILAAHRQAREQGFQGTDDASLIEWLGQPVHLVAGDYANIKITRPEDTMWAEIMLGRETP